MQNLYENFLHENVYIRSKYSNRAVIIHVNHMKMFLHENFCHEIFLHKNKANYGTAYPLILVLIIILKVLISAKKW